MAFWIAAPAKKGYIFNMGRRFIKDWDNENLYENSLAIHAQRRDLFAAIDENDVKTVERILKAKPRILHKTDVSGETPLMHALSTPERSAECIQTLIEAGANVNAKTSDRRTPLMHALSRPPHNAEFIRALIKAGADVNAKTSEGYTALHCVVNLFCWSDAAYDEETTKTVNLLADAGADLEAQQHWGWTPLMFALLEGMTHDVRALLAVGADPNAIFPQHAMPEFTRGRSILSVAMANIEVTQLLIEAGADVNARDYYGQTTIEVAENEIRDGSSDEFKQKVTACIELIRKAQKARE